jgi:hypothetical protein
MRAHIAVIISDFLELDTDEMDIKINKKKNYLIQIIEETLELDDILRKIHPPESTISSVLFDCKQVFCVCIEIDRNFFYTSLQKHLTNNNNNNGNNNNVDYLYVFDFEKKLNINSDIFENNNNNNDHYHQQFINKKNRCYTCIYSSLILFIKACERYCYLPNDAQNCFSDFILEPILANCLALFLYRIRSNAVLYSISVGDYIYNVNDFENFPLKQQNKHVNNNSSSNNSNSSNITNDEDFILQQQIQNENVFPRVLKEFRDSINYFQLTLNHLLTPSATVLNKQNQNMKIFNDSNFDKEANKDVNIEKFSIKNISSNSNRFKEKWKNLQNFVPKKNLTINNLKNTSLSPIDLLQKSFENKDFHSSDLSQNNNSNKLNFNTINKKNFESNKKQEKNNNDNLSESISYARAIAITLSNFLEQKFYET